MRILPGRPRGVPGGCGGGGARRGQAGDLRRAGPDRHLPAGAAAGLPDAAYPEWLRIYWANEAHIRSCDALIAELTPFRGPSADVGTVYELGFMRALGRPVFGYSNVARRFGARVLAALGGAARRRADGIWEDAEGMAVGESTATTT